MLNVNDIRNHFINELKLRKFTIDRSGSRTIEMIGASFLADEESIFGEPNFEYIDHELDWYNDMSTNINDIYGPDKAPPKAWQMSANEKGEINSNYGLLIFGKKYHDQYANALEELSKNPDSRRACMVYNRPSIWNEYNEDGKNDFICTNAVTYYIRDNRLHCVVQMRSNDVVFGYKNDYAWQEYVLFDMSDELNINPGNIYWQVQNLHVYERHFDLVR